MGDGIIAVVSDVLLIREAIADYLRRSPATRVVSTSAETLDVLLSALGTIAELPWRCACVGPVNTDPAFVDRLRHRAGKAGIAIMSTPCERAMR